MYKLLIADDEPLERQAIRFFVEHSKLEIDTIFEAGNGIDAVRIALTEQPDLCILDISMPGLNGLEAMEQIKSVNKHCKVFFSTAYSYFDYAVRALQLEALDFLVKPLKKETLLRVLNKGIDVLDAALIEEEYKTHVLDMTYVLEKRILRELVTGQADMETLWFLQRHNIQTDAQCISFFYRLSQKLDETEKERISRHLRREIQKTAYKYQLHVHSESIDFLLYGRETMQLAKMQNTISDIFHNVLEEHNIDSQEGIGTWVDDVFQLEQSHKEAKACIDGSSPQPKQAPHLSETAINAGAAGALPIEIQNMCKYLSDHYADKVKLEDVAQHVGFSKYYGSRLFKQYMGITIIEHLIMIRLEHAKELLRQGEFSIKQISYMVGYHDPNYFTWSFKKATGMSPVQYRYFQHTT